MTIQEAIAKKYITLEKISETQYWVIESKTGEKVITVSGPDDKGIILSIDKRGNVTTGML